MRSLICFLFKKIFNLIIICLLIDLSKSLKSFNYPYSLTLTNGNIFIIHQKGVTICDYSLSTIIENAIIFSEDEEIKTEESLSKVTTAFKYGYIISVINDKIYIFNEYGSSIFNGTEKILDDGETAKYYTLVPIIKEADYYNYVIGYVHEKLLYFLYYKYKFTSKINNRTTSRKAKQHKDKNNNPYYIENKGLSCQYMHDYDNLDILVCFFFVKISSKFNLIIDYYSAEETKIA